MTKTGTALGSLACASFVDALARRGVRLSLEGDRLAVEPASKLTPGDLSRLEQHKAELKARLRRNRVLL
jgi:TubC N-terminal docking domain